MLNKSEITDAMENKTSNLSNIKLITKFSLTVRCIPDWPQVFSGISLPSLLLLSNVWSSERQHRHLFRA